MSEAFLLHKCLRKLCSKFEHFAYKDKDSHAFKVTYHKLWIKYTTYAMHGHVNIDYFSVICGNMLYKEGSLCHASLMESGVGKWHNGKPLHLSSTPPRFEPGIIHLFQKDGILLECYQLVPPVLTTGSPKAARVLSCLCHNACKRSLAICRKNRASSPVRRLLCVPIWPVCAKEGC